MILVILIGLFNPMLERMGDGAAIGVSFLLLLVLMTAIVYMSISILLVIVNPLLTIGGAYKAAKSYFWRYFGLMWILGIAVAVVFMFSAFLLWPWGQLILIPIAIASIWLIFTYIVLVVENTGILASIKSSIKYVNGHFWAILGRLVVLFVVSVLFGAVYGLIITMLADPTSTPTLYDLLFIPLQVILTPLATIYVYLMYLDIVSEEPVAPTAAPVENGPAPEGV